MARRRVFRTRVTCPGIKTDLGPTVNQHAMVGRVVTLQKGSGAGVGLVLDGAVVGYLDAAIEGKVSAAIDRGQSFFAVIEKAFPNYLDDGRSPGDSKFKMNGAYLDIKVEYLLEKGQPAIKTKKGWRCVESPGGPSARPRSFFTTVAGVTFEGRQRMVARCSVGEQLILVRDPENQYDKGAIKVMRQNGEQLGFIPAHVSRGGDSSGLAYRMDQGEKYQCRISDLTGGGTKSRGVNIEITEGDEFEVLQTSVPSKVVPVAPFHSSVGWWIVAATVLVILVLIVMHQG